MRFVSSFRPGVRCSNHAEQYYSRGDRDIFCFQIFGFIFIFFAAVPCCAFAFFVYTSTDIYIAYQIKKLSTAVVHYLGYVRTYVRHPRREWYDVASELTSELFFPETCRWDSWHHQVAGLQLRSFKNLNSIVGLCSLSHNLMHFFPP